MSRFTPVLIALLGVATSPVFAQADQSQPANSGLGVDVIVNGQPISRNHVELMIGSINPDPSARGTHTEDARAAARQELVTQELLAQEARRLGLDRKPLVADQLSFQSRAVLSRALLQDHFEKNPVTTASLKTAYEWNRANGKIVEYKIRQILVNTPELAEPALAKLAKGEDFASVAKVHTLDPGGQNNGGDLGWFRPDIFVDHHFGDALAGIRKGQYSRQPIRTRFGWHIILVEDGPRPVADVESFDELEDEAREAIRQRTVQIRIEQLGATLASKAMLTGPGATGVAKASR
ncbi:MAG: peptidylprolyl isomerase [Panacagrimonas sp.]